MPIETLNQAEIDALIACPKQVSNPGCREKSKAKHRERDYLATSQDGKHEFVVFARQSLMIPNNFSAGLRWRSKTGEEVILLRCNGSDHEHANSLEHESFKDICHVHRITERYLAAGLKADKYAVTTRAYRTLGGALHHLTVLANISGMDTQPDEPDLFEDA